MNRDFNILYNSVLKNLRLVNAEGICYTEITMLFGKENERCRWILN